MNFMELASDSESAACWQESTSRSTVGYVFCSLCQVDFDCAVDGLSSVQQLSQLAGDLEMRMERHSSRLGRRQDGDRSGIWWYLDRHRLQLPTTAAALRSSLTASMPPRRLKPSQLHRSLRSQRPYLSRHAQPSGMSAAGPDCAHRLLLQGNT